MFGSILNRAKTSPLKFIAGATNPLLIELAERYRDLELLYGPVEENVRQFRQNDSELNNLRRALAQEDPSKELTGESKKGSYLYSIEYHRQVRAALLVMQAVAKASLEEALFRLIVTMERVRALVSDLSAHGWSTSLQRRIGIINLQVCTDLCARVQKSCSKYGDLNNADEDFEFLESMLEQQFEWVKDECPFRFVARVTEALDNSRRPVSDTNPQLIAFWVLQVQKLLESRPEPLYPVGDKITVARGICPKGSSVGDILVVTSCGRMEAVYAGLHPSAFS